MASIRSSRSEHGRDSELPCDVLRDRSSFAGELLRKVVEHDFSRSIATIRGFKLLAPPVASGLYLSVGIGQDNSLPPDTSGRYAEKVVDRTRTVEKGRKRGVIDVEPVPAGQEGQERMQDDSITELVFGRLGTRQKAERFIGNKSV